MRLLLSVLFILSLTCSSASAVTIDFFPMMDQNNDGKIYLGDNSGQPWDYSSYPATLDFTLTESPLVGEQFAVFVQWSHVDFSNNNFYINSTGPFTLSPSSGSQTFTGNNNDLNVGNNTLTFNLASSGGTWGYEDMLIQQFRLEYDAAEDLSGEAVPAPIPEPTTMLLFGTGLAGLAAFGRRRKAV